MSAFSHLMRGVAQIQRLIDTDSTGTASYAAAADIRGRMVFSRRLVISKSGEAVTSEAVYYTDEEIKPGDLITYHGREWPVIAAAEKSNVFGTFDHWEASL